MSKLFNPHSLAGGKWVIQTVISTRTLDAHTFYDYYQRGEVEQLAEKIELKRKKRLTRKNTPISVRVLYQSSSTQAKVLELETPKDIFEHALLDAADQRSLKTHMVRCIQFKKPPSEKNMGRIRLILDSQITQEDHDETIINPDDRDRWHEALRDFLDKMEVYGNPINLSNKPGKIDEFDSLEIVPPALQIRTTENKTRILPAPKVCTRQTLLDRSRERARAIRKHGFLEQRPINPLLAFPKKLGKERAARMQRDLNWILQKQKINFRFGQPYLYETVREIKQAVENGEYDTLLAVLPEGRRKTYSTTDTHEQIKKQVPIPSQCVHYDNTLAAKWVNRTWTDFKKTNRKQARRVENNYRQCLLNLLVKHNWVPFAPSDPFHYNVHVGIDVGGQHNNRIMACVGYGLSQPQEDLIFLPYQIDIDTQQAEPIPVDYLYQGLYSLFEELYEHLVKNDQTPNFDTVLFFRDGELRGQGDDWNEMDALKRLHQEFLKKEWISEKALWTATEVSKRAEYWRILRQDDLIVRRPIVGRCAFPFVDRNEALVCTTGSPYLSQGTASPLLVRIQDICGQANREEVLRDLIWEADMCFTKIDSGLSLPWVLHVANTGALQQSKAYHVTGITV